jgi:hypothetical protein
MPLSPKKSVNSVCDTSRLDYGEENVQERETTGCRTPGRNSQDELIAAPSSAIGPPEKHTKTGARHSNALDRTAPSYDHFFNNIGDSYNSGNAMETV